MTANERMKKIEANIKAAIIAAANNEPIVQVVMPPAKESKMDLLRRIFQ